jgi:uncharacterized protein (TIGR02448 family)
MSRLPLFTLLAGLVIASQATASSFVATTDTLGGALANSAELSTDMSFSLRDDKRIVAARDDAASFVASAGAVRGARLEAALQLLRPQLAGDDLQLAEAILAR